MFTLDTVVFHATTSQNLKRHGTNGRYQFSTESRPEIKEINLLVDMNFSNAADRAFSLAKQQQSDPRLLIVDSSLINRRIAFHNRLPLHCRVVPYLEKGEYHIYVPSKADREDSIATLRYLRRLLALYNQKSAPKH